MQLQLYTERACSAHSTSKYKAGSLRSNKRKASSKQGTNGEGRYGMGVRSANCRAAALLQAASAAGLALAALTNYAMCVSAWGIVRRFRVMCDVKQTTDNPGKKRRQNPKTGLKNKKKRKTKTKQRLGGRC
jgi:hypothetical protein